MIKVESMNFLVDIANVTVMNYFYLLLLIMWLVVCSIYAALEINAKTKLYNSDITTFSAFWFMAMLLFYVLSSRAENEFINQNFAVILCCVFGLLVTVLLAILANIKKKKNVVFRNFLIAVGLICGVFVLSELNLDKDIIQYVVIGIASVYFISTIVAVIIFKKRKHNLNKFGTIYVLISESFFIAFTVLIRWFDVTSISFAVGLSIFAVLVIFQTLYNLIFTRALVEVNTDFANKEQELSKAEEQITELVYINPDTKLPNIARLELDLDQRTVKASHLMMLNLDNYKTLSNTMGFRKTAMIMTQISNNILWNLAGNGNLYHISNDKFVIVFNGSTEGCVSCARKLLDVFTLQDYFTINLKPYMGYTEVAGRVVEFEALLRELELASEAARGNNDFLAQYTFELYKKVQRRVVMETHLKNAVETRSWELYLQPKVSVQTNMIIGAEGLIRWKGQEGKISPAMFIPLAEELGLIVDIGKTIIEKGFAYAKAIADNLKPDFVLAVNLSAFQLMRKDFLDYVKQMIAKYEVNPINITFEITESAFIDNMDRVRDVIVEIRKLGFKFSLDDFGTGYSSISYLSSFDLDEVKFDREFMVDIEKDRKNLVILETITNLANNLGLHIVTEGIESKAQLEKVRQIGCEVYQGYYFSKPVSFNDFVGLLKRNMRGEYYGMDEEPRN